MTWKRINPSPKSNSTSKWDPVVLLVGVLSLFLDFFFLYLPTVKNPQSLIIDWHLAAALAVLRSIADLVLICSLILEIHGTLSKPPKLEVLIKRYEVIKATKYTKSSFIIDLVAILPLPQFIILLGQKTEDSDVLVRSVILQLPFRVAAVLPFSQKKFKITSILAKNVWAGALQNLLYFIIMSNVAGSIFYNVYISELLLCKHDLHATDTDAANLDWDEVITRCNKILDLDYGILSDAFTTKIGTRSFIQRYTFCLAWGLKCLSSFGQIFSASSLAVDTLYSFLITVFGLVLFGDLLSRMQTALQCTEQNENRQRGRQRMVDEWMKYHQLPPHLKKLVKQAIQSEWSATHGTNDDVLLDSLPWDTRCEIRKHLYLEIIRAMPLFKEMDKHLVNTLCGYLRTFSANEGTYVAFESEPVREMLFIFSGQLEVSSARDIRQPTVLGPGDLCGKELLQWCSHPTTSTENLQPSTQTVKCLTNVDAFSLRPDDVKLLAIQFHHDGKFLRAFQRYAA